VHGKAFRGLAGSGDAAPFPAPPLELLGVGVGCAASLNSAIRFLRKAQGQHPSDFRINFVLSVYLGMRDRNDEALVFATAAIAVRPESPVAYTRLGCLRFRQGKLDEATAAFRE